MFIFTCTPLSFLPPLTPTPQNESVKAVIDMTESWERFVADAELMTRFGPSLPWLRLPTPDYAAPAVEDIRRAITFIEERTRAG
jgi:protein-tyrosine phosphatase